MVMPAVQEGTVTGAAGRLPGDASEGASAALRAEAVSVAGSAVQRACDAFEAARAQQPRAGDRRGLTNHASGGSSYGAHGRPPLGRSWSHRESSGSGRAEAASGQGSGSRRRGGGKRGNGHGPPALAPHRGTGAGTRSGNGRRSMPMGQRGLDDRLQSLSLSSTIGRTGAEMKRGRAAIGRGRGGKGTIQGARSHSQSSTRGTKRSGKDGHEEAGSTFTLSRYVWQPLLVDGRKFDLRLYVLVVSYDPPVAYLHEEGLARLAPLPYDASPVGLRDRLRHLTNASLSRKAASAQEGDTDTGPGPSSGPAGDASRDKATGSQDQADPPRESASYSQGLKWSLPALKQRLRRDRPEVDWDQVWTRVADVCAKAVLASESAVSTAMAAHERRAGSAFVSEAGPPGLLQPAGRGRPGGKRSKGRREHKGGRPGGLMPTLGPGGVQPSPLLQPVRGKQQGNKGGGRGGLAGSSPGG